MVQPADRLAVRRVGCRSGLHHSAAASRLPLHRGQLPHHQQQARAALLLHRQHPLGRESRSCSAAAAPRRAQGAVNLAVQQPPHYPDVGLHVACAWMAPCPSCPRVCRWTLQSCWPRCSRRWRSCELSTSCGPRQMHAQQLRKRQQRQAQQRIWKLQCERQRRRPCDWLSLRRHGPAVPRECIGLTASETATAAASRTTKRARTQTERLAGATALGAEAPVGAIIYLARSSNAAHRVEEADRMSEMRSEPAHCVDTGNESCQARRRRGQPLSTSE